MQLKVFANDTDWYVATDLDDAIKQWEKDSGEKIEDYDRDDWDECDLNVTFKINSEAHISEEIVGPLGCTIEREPSGNAIITASLSAWAEHNGRGLLCSTEY